MNLETNKEKLLSIIIPTYNAEKYLDKCLTSLILEDETLFEQLEVLVINDGSPDKSRDVAQKYVDKYPNVYKIIDKENGGHGSGINVGADEATGMYFKVLDADDWVDITGFENFMKKLVNISKERQSDVPDVIITFYQRYDISTGKIEDKISRPSEYDKNYTLGEVMDQWLGCHEDMHFWGVTYNTKFYQKLGYKLAEGIFYEDQEYATVPLSYAKTVRFIDEMVYVYRVGDVNQSVFGDTQVKRRSHLEKVIERLVEQYDNQSNMPMGADRYYRKKTAMVITSYYQIMLLKNKDKKLGRNSVAEVNKMLEKEAPEIYAMTAKKCKGFICFSYLHISNGMYEFWAPKIIGAIRKIKGQRV